MSNAFLISCSDHYDHRMQYWDTALRSLGFSTTYLTSDFSHTAKKKFSCAIPGCVQLHVHPYRKNLSLGRIFSHMEFARAVSRYLGSQKTPPTILVCLLPPNCLAEALARYRRRHPNILLIFDVFDLWPESFPSSRLKQLLALPFRVWASLRDQNLKYADFVTTECELFRRILSLPESSSRVIYFALPSSTTGISSFPALPRDRAEIAYLGSINNLIDIPRISAFLKALSKIMPVRLHIIGEGESRTAFCQAAEEAGAEVVFHGPVFDETEKDTILRSCHFGLNVMKSSVCVGLTMKSVDYLRHGLPLLSTIPGDTEELIQSKGFGLVFDEPEAAAAAVAKAIQHGTEPLATAASAAFSSLFSSDHAEAACRAVLLSLLPEQGGAS